MKVKEKASKGQKKEKKKTQLEYVHVDGREGDGNE